MGISVLEPNVNLKFFNKILPKSTKIMESTRNTHTKWPKPPRNEFNYQLNGALPQLNLALLHIKNIYVYKI